MDWAVTTPLLLKAVSMLRVKFHQAKSLIMMLLLADFFMMLTGYIGEWGYKAISITAPTPLGTLLLP